jgi:hypothetical protein
MTGNMRALYAISLLLLLASGCVASLFRSTLSSRALLGIVVLPALAAVAAWNWWISLVIRPYLGHWSGPRLAPVLALLKGYSLYQPPDRGPVSGWIYPPCSALAYLPAVVLGDPTAMVFAGRVLGLLYSISQDSKSDCPSPFNVRVGCTVAGRGGFQWC